MDTPSYPSERFLALSLRSQSSKIVSFLEALKTGLIVLGGVVLITAILVGLFSYVYFCVAAQCVKTAETAKATGTKVKPDEIKFKKAEMDYVWVQLMPDEGSGTPGGRLVRAIGPEGGTCPSIAQGGNTFQMHQRVPATRTAFPILLCEFVLIEKSEARIGSALLPARTDEPNDVVVIGDTGCRMVYWQSQPCRDPTDWPFAKIAESANSKVVAGKSFILHVGDFHYRENPCIDSSTRCGASPFGDNWATWREEFFEPAKRLLLAAPWVIMRGNHEDCARAGAGWIFLFALPGLYQSGSACDSAAQTYQVNIGKTEDAQSRPRILVVMDTSDERNRHNVEANREQYRKQLNELKAEEPDRSTQEVWLALHQPLWGRNMNGEQEETANRLQKKQDGDDNSHDSKALECVNEETESALPAIREKFELAKDKRIARLVFAGDNHAFQFFWPKAGLSPIQIIAGNGGTKLDTLYPLVLPAGTKAPCKKRDPDTSPPKVNDVTSRGIAGSDLTLMQHGFTIMRRVGTMWTATQFDRDGNRTVDCRFSEALSSKSSDLTNCDQVLVKQASSG